MTLLAALLLLAQDPVSGWIRDLGAEEPAVRETAQRKLLQAGPEAVPALREAMETTTDAEVKFACERLLKEIGDTSQVIDLIDPHLVTLERGEYTLAEAAAALSKSGRTVKVEVGDPDARVTVGWNEAPLIRALDELCAAHGKLSYSVGQSGDITVASGSPIAHPVGYSGPVRVDVVSIEETRRTDFSGEPVRTMTVTLKLSSLNPDADAWKETLAVKSIELEDGTELGTAEAQDEMGMGGVMGAGAVIRIVGAMGGRSADPAFTFKAAPRTAARLGAIRGTAELTMPVGEEFVVLAEGDVGKEMKVGDYTIKLESFKRGKAQISFKDETAKSNVPSELEGLFDIEELGMGGNDPKRAEIERRLDFDAVVGVDESGAEQKLETDWKKRGNVRSLTSVDGRMTGTLPTVTVEADESTKEIRFKFRARSTTRTLPFAIESVPLPE